MTVETAAKTISLIVATVVMVTAGAILDAAILQRYGAINDRVRAMSREPLDLQYQAGLEPAPPRP